METVPSKVTENIALIKEMIAEALKTANDFLSPASSGGNSSYAPWGSVTQGRRGDSPVNAKQTKDAAGKSPPSISAAKPRQYPVNIAPPAAVGSYSTGFKMPAVVNINDNTVAKNPMTTWNEPIYNEFMLTELKAKIQNGFNAVATTIEVRNRIWSRLIQRHGTTLSDAISRRQTRWSRMGHTFSADTQETMNNFAFASKDYERDNRVKTAELKDDNRKFSITASIKGEQIAISKAEDMATRALDIAKKIVDMNVQAFEANVDRYTDVRIPEFENELYYYSKSLSMKLKKTMADISQFVYNTKLISEKARVNDGFDFDADVEEYEADAYFNEVKAGVNLSYNELSLTELDSNIDLRMKELDSNMKAFFEKTNQRVDLADKMGAVYAENLRSIMEAMTALIHVAYEDKETKQII